jgi:Arc/MetJ family transcription regulator
MKRTNLMLDEELLKTATRAMGAKTYSEAVNRALDEAVHLIKIRNLGQLFGQDVWQGDLSEMREDRGSKKKSK